MQCLHFRVHAYGLAVVFLLGTLVPDAHADPITPSYAITDLGTGAVTATAANGNRVSIDLETLGAFGQGNQVLSAAVHNSQVIGLSNGQAVYPFILSPVSTMTPYQGIMVNFPLAAPPPVNAANTYGNPVNAYSIVTSIVTNANGVFAAVDSVGVAGHQGADTAYYVPKNADGSMGSPVTMWTGTTQIGQGPVGGATLTGMNIVNQVLGQMSNQPDALPDAVVYNIKTGLLTDLTTYLVQQSYHDVVPLAIDDQGRMLLAAAQGASGGEHLLILSPDGVSTGPLIAPVPEPSSLAVIALAMAAFAVHRSRRR